MITEAEKRDILKKLDTTLDEAIEAVKETDPLRVVYEESQWRVKDLLAHIVTWEMEMVRGLYTHRRGGQYLVKGAEDRATYSDEDFNAYTAHVRYDDSLEKIYADWRTARDWMKVLVGAMKLEEFAVEFLHPWGLRGTTIDLVNSLFSHQAEHMDAILKASSNT